jgi:hypothetical protein
MGGKMGGMGGKGFGKGKMGGFGKGKMGGGADAPPAL